jgi:hypothetical protein
MRYALFFVRRRRIEASASAPFRGSSRKLSAAERVRVFTLGSPDALRAGGVAVSSRRLGPLTLDPRPTLERRNTRPEETRWILLAPPSAAPSPS